MAIKSSLEWLIQAAPLWLDGCSNKYTDHLNVIDGLGYATDGHRLHVAPVMLQDGSYNPVTMELVAASNLSEKKDVKLFADRVQNSPDHEVTKVIYGDFEQRGNDSRSIRLRRALKKDLGYCCFSKHYVQSALNGNNNIDLFIIGMGTEKLTMFGEHMLGRFYIAGAKPK